MWAGSQIMADPKHSLALLSWLLPSGSSGRWKLTRCKLCWITSAGMVRDRQIVCDGVKKAPANGLPKAMIKACLLLLYWSTRWECLDGIYGQQSKRIHLGLLTDRHEGRSVSCTILGNALADEVSQPTQRTWIALKMCEVGSEEVGSIMAFGG